MCRPGPSAWLSPELFFRAGTFFLEGLTRNGEEIQARIEEAFPNGAVHAPGDLRRRGFRTP